MQAREKDNRRDWIIVLLILLLGLLCIIFAGGWALRISPSWKLDSNMESNLDPVSDFLTARPDSVIEPIDFSILTKPAWMDIYLTPDAIFETGTPVPTRVQNTQPPPATRTVLPTTTLGVTPTRTATPRIINPTFTSVVNPPTRTRTPIPSNTPVVSADLSITVTDGSATYIVGGMITYTITVRNTAGPTVVTGATVTDTFPAALSNITWTCTSTAGGTCPANGAGNINATVNLPIGSSVTFTVNATISPAATGNLVNTATVTPPGTVSDPALANNTATDTDTPIFNVDLDITKTDGAALYTPGLSTTYTIVVNNAGPSDAIGATVTDNFPAQVTGVTWSCAATGGATCTANGTGNITDIVNIPAGSTLTYTAIASISSATNSNLSNTVNVAAPVGYNETVLGNNAATDTDTASAQTDLAITKTDGSATYVAGGAISYTIQVTNAGPSNATGASLADAVPAAITGVTVNCVASGGAACGVNASAGNAVSFTGMNVPVGAGNFLTITVNGTVNIATTGNLTNTATIAAGAAQTDPTPGNNSATDTDIPATADLQVTLTDNATDYAANLAVTYTIIASNPAGPGGVTGASVSDIFPANLTNITWTCTGAGGASCTTGGAGNINDTVVNIPVGAWVTYTVNVTVIAAPSGNLVNTATINPPAGVTDPTPGNNSATDTDQLITASSFGGYGTGNIGPGADGNIEFIPPGTTATLQFGTPLLVNGHAGYDFVYYEWPQGTNPGVLMDLVIIQIGDGRNWYTVYNWGDGAADANANLQVPLGVPNITTCAGEPDNCEIDASFLYNATGVAIQLDGVVPAGTYPYIRIIAPGAPPDAGDGVEVDGIFIIP